MSPVFTYVPGLHSDGLLDGKEDTASDEPFAVPQLNDGVTQAVPAPFASCPLGQTMSVVESQVEAVEHKS